MIEGVDYSWARPGGATLAAAGKRFAFRYLPYPGHAGKGLSVPEAADLHDNGLDIGLVFERDEGRMRGGYALGVEDGLLSQSALEGLGVPLGVVVYFACDYNAPFGDYNLIADYLKGASEVLGYDRVGVYGHYDLIEWLATNMLVRWRWQTYAWSGGLVSDFAHVLQYLNGQDLNGAVDFCRAHVPDFGQWKAEKEEPPVDDDIDDDLRGAMAAREAIRFVASGPEYSKAYRVLYTEGYITGGARREQVRHLASDPDVARTARAVEALRAAGINLGGW